MPVYKSYIDPLVLHYVHYLCGIELGFTFGHYEDQPQIGFVENLLKKIGIFLIRREPRNFLNTRTGHKLSSETANYVNQALFQEVLEANHFTTLFQNDERLRSGKFNNPIHPDKTIKYLIKTF